MCGIAGIIQADPSTYSSADIKKMTDSLSHRGPDGEGHWSNQSGNVWLGHRRLSIIDLSNAAAQPMHYTDRYSIVHNGEIYNYLELKNELGKLGYSFRTQSDTEVILAAYAHWSDECVEHFDGMFAFAIWDEEEQELFAARDRFGEKPFFYYCDGENFVFGSEMKALWAAGVERQPNLQMLFNFLTIGYVDNPSRPEETFYENIFKLPPASRLYYSPGDAEPLVLSYWDLDSENVNKKISDTEAMEVFRQLLSTSVSRRLRSDVTLGTSLSGGVDSSSIVAMIGSLQGHASSLQTFTAVFPGFEKDEWAFAKMMAEHAGCRQQSIAVTGNDVIADWEKLCYHQEEPFGSASVFAQFKVFELAKQHHVKVLLDGQGADETLAGYHKYYKWYWQELFMKRRLLRSGELKAARQIGIKERFGYKNVIASLFPELASVVLERQYLLHALRQEDLDHDFVKHQSHEAYYSTPANFNLNGALYFNTRTHGLEELLRYADRNSMAHGRETRLPFLDHQLVEFIFTLPSKFKIRKGWSKWLLRTSMENILPAEITWRRDKVGFEPPQQQWMQQNNWHEAIRDARKKLVERKILKKEVLDRPVTSSHSHDAENYDWRYLTAAAFL